MTTLTLAYSAVHKKVQKEINWKMVCLIGFAMVCFLLVIYALLVNELTGGTYLVKSYEKQIKSLSQETRNLEVSFAETGFLEQVQQKARDLSFEKTTSVKYIQVLDTSLAKAK